MNNPNEYIPSYDELKTEFQKQVKHDIDEYHALVKNRHKRRDSDDHIVQRPNSWYAQCVSVVHFITDKALDAYDYARRAINADIEQNRDHVIEALTKELQKLKPYDDDMYAVYCECYGAITFGPYLISSLADIMTKTLNIIYHNSDNPHPLNLDYCPSDHNEVTTRLTPCRQFSLEFKMIILRKYQLARAADSFLSEAVSVAETTVTEAAKKSILQKVAEAGSALYHSVSKSVANKFGLNTSLAAQGVIKVAKLAQTYERLNDLLNRQINSVLTQDNIDFLNGLSQEEITQIAYTCANTTLNNYLKGDHYGTFFLNEAKFLDEFIAAFNKFREVHMKSKADHTKLVTNRSNNVPAGYAVYANQPGLCFYTAGDGSGIRTISQTQTDATKVLLCGHKQNLD